MFCVKANGKRPSYVTSFDIRPTSILSYDIQKTSETTHI